MGDRADRGGVGVFFVGAEPCVRVRFSPSPHPLSPETAGEGGNVAFRRLVVRPSRLHSAVAAATALQTATRRRGTKIRRPVSPKRWRRADGSRNRFFSIRFLCFCIL